MMEKVAIARLNEQKPLEGLLNCGCFDRSIFMFGTREKYTENQLKIQLPLNINVMGYLMLSVLQLPHNLDNNLVDLHQH